ncbi:MAG: helix-turn-helix transcriptional regulator [Chloroflexota bacterium]|nr:helix-turn-helix transcriptional regulator [Chloroflexota bacterium]
MTTYGQFCPVAKASEIFAERWTPLILRELLMGSHRFNELERGLPRISRTLLSQRLKSLEDVGLLVRQPSENDGRPEYHLTQAGLDLYDVIERLGAWSHRWFNPLVDLDNLDPTLLMWDIHRRLNRECLPDRQVVVQFDFSGDNTGSYWLVLEPGEPSVCWDPPGFEVDLLVECDSMTIHRIWLGYQSIEDALRRGTVRLEGPQELTRAFPGWLALSTFAGMPRGDQMLNMEPQAAAAPA